MLGPERDDPPLLPAPADVARLFKAVLATVQRRIERRTAAPRARARRSTRCSSTASRPGARTQHPARPPRVRARRLALHGAWLHVYRNLHSHHIVFRSHGGPDAWNRTSLCAATISAAYTRGSGNSDPRPRARRAALRASARDLRAGRADSPLSFMARWPISPRRAALFCVSCADAAALFCSGDAPELRLVARHLAPRRPFGTR